jgi:curved DNA-binding protein
MEYKDYYKILGVTKSSSQDEIKKAYKQLAKKYHPDKNRDNKSAEDKFKDISEAYEVIGNEKNRKKYDQLGANWKNYREGGFGGFDFSGGMGDMFGGGSGNFSDFFNSFFNGSSFNGGSGFNRSQKGRNINSSLTISLIESYTGVERVVNIQGESIKISIKPGVVDGHKLKLSGRGAAGMGGGSRGDLIITITVAPSGQLTRKGDDLYMGVDVDLYTMVLGGKKDIVFPDGKKVAITIGEHTQNGKKLKLKGFGFASYGNQSIRGACIIEMKAVLPEKLNFEEKELFTKLRDIKG